MGGGGRSEVGSMESESNRGLTHTIYVRARHRSSAQGQCAISAVCLMLPIVTETGQWSKTWRAVCASSHFVNGKRHGGRWSHQFMNEWMDVMISAQIHAC